MTEVKNTVSSFRSPVSYNSLVKPYLKKWRKGKRFYKKLALNTFYLLWGLIPLIAVGTYFFELGPIVSIKNQKAFSSFLSVATPTQAAIVGIIIPIIFALVEQLFKNQDTFFKAFLYWSKVVQLTISSLLLVLFLMTQLVLPIEVTSLTFVFTFLWFALNVLGAMRLVLVSVSFFFPKKRFSLILGYIRQVALPAEIERNLATTLRSTNELSSLLFNGFLQKALDRIPKRKIDCPKTQEILHHLSIPVLESIRNGAYEEFQNHLDFLIEAHAFLVTESGVIGEVDDNYSILSTNPFWGMKQFMNWNDPYRQIITESASKVEHDDRFFRTCSHYCVLGVYNRIAGKAPQRITGSSIEWATMVHYSLMNHIFKMAAAHLEENSPAGHEITLPAYLNNAYLAGVKTYIGSWESLKQSIVIHLKDKEHALDVKYLQDLETHLRECIFSICRCVVNGDRSGSFWLLDTFLRWNDNLPRLGQSGWLLESQRGFAGNFHQMIENLSADHTDEMRHDAIISIYNLWFDTALTLYGSLWGYSGQIGADFPKIIAAQLYNQRVVDQASRTDHLYQKLTKSTDLLHSFIRLMSDSQYEANITDRLGRGFRNPFDDDKISGRCYVSGGGNYLYETFANLMLAHAASVRKGSILQERSINNALEFILEDGERVGAITHSLISLLNALRSHSLEQIQSIYSHNFGATISSSKAKFYKKVSILRVEAFREEIQSRYDQSVIDAPISQELMRAKREEAEAQIFDGIELKFPVSLFSQCAYTDPYSRQTLSQTVRCARTSTFKEVFIERHQRFQTTQDNVLYPNIQDCENIVLNWPLSLALDRLGWHEYRPDSAHNFWRTFKESIDSVRQQGLTPIVLDSANYIQFLDSWEHGMEREPVRPADFVHSFDENFQQNYGDKYKKHLYDTPVFNWRLHNTNAFIILGQEQLEGVLFRRYADNTILELGFKPLEEAPHKGAVVFQWEYDVEISGGNVHRINLEAINEDDF